jgi:hypothetical protein
MITIGERESPRWRANERLSARTLDEGGSGEGPNLQHPESLLTVCGGPSLSPHAPLWDIERGGALLLSTKAGEPGSKEAANDKTSWSIPRFLCPKVEVLFARSAKS